MISASRARRRSSTSRVTWKLRTRAAKFLRANLYDVSANCSFAIFEMAGAQWKVSRTITHSWFRGFSIFTKPRSMSSGCSLRSQLQETQDRLFFDEKNGGYFSGKWQGREHAAADEGR